MRKKICLTFVGMLCGLGAMAQTVVVGDTLRPVAARVDSLRGRCDSLRVMGPDSLKVLADSVPMLPHSMPMLSDTVQVLSDSVLMLSDSVQLLSQSMPMLPHSMPMLSDTVLLHLDSLVLSEGEIPAPADTVRPLAVDSLRLVNDASLMAREGVTPAGEASAALTEQVEEPVKAAPKKPAKPKQSPAVAAFYQSLNHLSASYFAYFRLWDDLDIPAPRRVRPNPGFYKLFVPPTYYEAPIREALDIHWTPEDRVPTPVDSLLMGKRNRGADVGYPLPDVRTLAAADRWSNAILRNFYLQHPEMLVNNELYLKDLKPLEDDMIVRAPRQEKFRSFLEPETPVESLNPDNELLVLRPNFWTHKGNGYLNFTQHYISDNWYKGGESTNALLGGLVLEANFDDRQRLEFENKLEMKLGFITAPSDTVHKYKTNADLFRLNSKLGVKAFKNWYYTLAAEFKTQFFANYKTNTNNMISNFLSPGQLDITVGMDFKQNKKNYSLSLLGSPLAYSFIYIGNDKIYDPGAFNVEPGRKTANLFGSKFTGNLKWKIIPNIVWESKLEYFTTYEKVIASWENTFNFVLNRYLSTRLFVHARYDDGVTLKEGEKSYFQLQELLSFGINYTW